jgi:hypothetical protein
MTKASFLLVAAGLATLTGSIVAARAADDDKALEVLAAARKAIGKKIQSLETLSLEAGVQRNIGDMQMNSDTEILLSLPDKYLRSDTSTGGMMSMSTKTGFNGTTAIRPSGASILPGGGMVIRMGPGGPMPPQEKLSPEQEEELNQAMLRTSRNEISRLMLGWFATVHPALSVEYAYAGEAESPDGKAHVIDAKNADGFAARLFIDQQTSLPLMLTFQGPRPRIVTDRVPRRGGTNVQDAHGGGSVRELTEEERKKARDEADKQLKALQSQPPAMAEHTLFFEDWRTVDDVQLPHTLRRAVDGTTTEEWTIRKVKLNPRLDASKFER